MGCAMSLPTAPQPGLSEPSDAWRPDRREVAVEMARITRDMLPKLSAALAFSFMVFAAGHWLTLSHPAKGVMAATALATSGVFVALVFFWRRPAPPLQLAIPSAVLASVLALVNSSLHMWLVPYPAQTTNFLVFMVGNALFVLSTPGFVGTTALTCVAWLTLNSMAPPHPDWTHFGFALFSFTMVTGLAHVLVVRHLARLFAMRRRDLLVQERLNQALKEARQAAVAKDQFLAAMSHELRTPLNSIIGFSNLLGKNLKEANPRQMDFIDRIRRNGNHLLGLIDQLLNLSLVASGRLKIQETHVDLPRLVHEVVADQQCPARRKGLELKAEAPESLLSLHTDGPRLRQILTHLVSNAIKFTDQGSVMVLLRAEERRGVAIEVRDTGRGIAPEDLERVFDRFVQVEAGTARNYEGSGLGLAISRELSRLLGFELTAQSRLDVGSTFTLRLRPRSSLTSTSMPAPKPLNESNRSHGGDAKNAEPASES